MRLAVACSGLRRVRLHRPAKLCCRREEYGSVAAADAEGLRAYEESVAIDPTIVDDMQRASLRYLQQREAQAMEKVKELRDKLASRALAAEERRALEKTLRQTAFDIVTQYRPTRDEEQQSKSCSSVEPLKRAA
jgi:hypothetical protein